MDIHVELSMGHGRFDLGFARHLQLRDIPFVRIIFYSLFESLEQVYSDLT